jgi:hypothetical protein
MKNICTFELKMLYFIFNFFVKQTHFQLIIEYDENTLTSERTRPVLKIVYFPRAFLQLN